MPLVPLGLNCLSAPGDSSLALLSVTMLWPGADQEAERISADQPRIRANALAAIRAGIINTQAIEPAEMAGLMEALATGSRADEITALSGPRLYEGALVGETVRELLAYDPPAKSVEAAMLAAADTQRGSADRSVSLASMRKFWTEYRPVAHLWAAWLHRAALGHGHDFPCAAADLGDFLAWAREFLVLGERYQLGGGRRRTLLDRHSAWWIAPEIEQDLPA